jgi:hypothetical protein
VREAERLGQLKAKATGGSLICGCTHLLRREGLVIDCRRRPIASATRTPWRCVLAHSGRKMLAVTWACVARDRRTEGLSSQIGRTTTGRGSCAALF